VPSDITDLKRAQTAQKLLMDELNHRVKNMLAVVQAISRQTKRAHADPESFYEALEQGLMALSAAHNLLTRTNWEGTTLSDLAKSLISTFGLDEKRLVLEGPSVALSPNAAISLCLAFHELATNAMKYGPWSGDRGTVTLTWQALPKMEPPQLVILWVERGGPKVNEPKKKGFGTQLLERTVGPEFGGAVDLDFAERGLTCRMELTLNDKIRLG